MYIVSQYDLEYIQELPKWYWRFGARQTPLNTFLIPDRARVREIEGRVGGSDALRYRKYDYKQNFENI